ncbi:MAG: hypothetical protein Q8R24_00250 [Legionellaceae bacterium]|nr:hypothetical protein [Legionellaceae bacterium]
MPTSSGTTVGTSRAPLPTLPRSPRIARHAAFCMQYCPKSSTIAITFNKNGIYKHAPVQTYQAHLVT